MSILCTTKNNRIFTHTTLYCTATSDACSFGRHQKKHKHAPQKKGADHNTYMHHRLDAKKKKKCPRQNENIARECVVEHKLMTKAPEMAIYLQK